MALGMSVLPDVYTLTPRASGVHIRQTIDSGDTLSTIYGQTTSAHGKTVMYHIAKLTRVHRYKLYECIQYM